MVRSAAIRARAGPRAVTPATRRAGDTLLVMDRMWTTWPSRSRAASGDGGAVEREVVAPVVLHQERPVRRDHLEQRVALGAAPRLARRVGDVRLGVEQPRPARRERLVQGGGRHGAALPGERHDPQPGVAGGGDRAPVGGRLHHHRVAGRGERPEDRRQRALAARHHDRVGAGRRRDAGRRGGRELAGEPLAQLRDPRRRRPLDRRRRPRGPGERRPDRTRRQQLLGGVAAVQVHPVLRRGPQRPAVRAGVAARGAERGGLPPEVHRRGRPRVADEVARARGGSPPGPRQPAGRSRAAPSPGSPATAARSPGWRAGARPPARPRAPRPRGRRAAVPGLLSFAMTTSR